MPNRKSPPLERFLKRASLVESGCWTWNGSRNTSGYPQFAVNGRLMLVHRWAYEHFVEPIPDGAILDHLCHGPDCTLGVKCPHRACVNPWHLTPTTNRDNLLRGAGVAAQAAQATHCPKGHPYEGENLYVRPSTGARYCRECSRESNRKWVSRRRAEAESRP